MVLKHWENTDPLRFSWLRENLEPLETVANSYLFYNISQEDIDRLCKKTEYCK